jgi:hypothetical protein
MVVLNADDLLDTEHGGKTGGIISGMEIASNHIRSALDDMLHALYGLVEKIPGKGCFQITDMRA